MVVEFNLKDKKDQIVFEMKFEVEKHEERAYLKPFGDNKLDKISNYGKELYFALNKQKYLLLNHKKEESFFFQYKFVKEIIRCYEEKIQILYSPLYEGDKEYTFIKKSRYNLKEFELFNGGHNIIIEKDDEFENDEERTEYTKHISTLEKVSELLCKESHRKSLFTKKDDDSIRIKGAYIINKDNYLNFFISLITKQLNIQYGANECMINRDYYLNNVGKYTFK